MNECCKTAHSGPPRRVISLGAVPRNLLNRRRDGRVAEGARLESVFTRKGNVGSNPTLSATESAVLRTRRNTVEKPAFGATFRMIAPETLVPLLNLVSRKKRPSSILLLQARVNSEPFLSRECPGAAVLSPQALRPNLEGGERSVFALQMFARLPYQLTPTAEQLFTCRDQSFCLAEAPANDRGDCRQLPVNPAHRLCTIKGC